jgi:hypothetical protein
MKNQRKFFDWAGQQLGIKNFEEWYNIKPSEVQKLGSDLKIDIASNTKLGGASLLISEYGKSLIKALITVYPENKWEPWRFLNVQWKFWADNDNVIVCITVVLMS